MKNLNQIMECAKAYGWACADHADRDTDENSDAMETAERELRDLLQQIQAPAPAPAPASVQGLAVLMVPDIYTRGVPAGHGSITAHSPEAVAAIVAHLQGQMHTLAGLLSEAAEIVRDAEAEGCGESDRLQALIQKSELALRSVWAEHFSMTIKGITA